MSDKRPSKEQYDQVFLLAWQAALIRGETGGTAFDRANADAQLFFILLGDHQFEKTIVSARYLKTK